MTTPAKKPECFSCETGALGPSLWASAKEREFWFSTHCEKHAAELKAERDAWDAVGKKMAEIEADPKKKAEFDAKLKARLESRSYKRRMKRLLKPFETRSSCCDCPCHRRHD